MSIADGKNLINFSLIYFLGNEIRNKRILLTIPMRKLIAFFIISNLLLCIAYVIFENRGLSKFIMKYAFGYNSPLLILNAMFFFSIFTKINIHSKCINWIAGSVFVVYLLHSNSYIQRIVWPIINQVKGNDDMMIPFIYFLFCLIIFTECILIDKFCQPLYHALSNKCYSLIVDVLPSPLKD